MARNFYYKTQAEIVAGSAQFAAQLLTDFAALGLTNGQATAFGTVNTSLQSAWSTSSNPETRTPVAIQATREAIKNMRAMAIPLAKQIVGNSAVTDSQLISLGLLPRNSPTPIPPEMNPPEVDILSVVGRLVNARVRQAGADHNRRPDGSAGAVIYTFVGPAAPTDPNAYVYQGLAARSKTQILFPNDVPSGATAWIAAAWLSRRGQRGFACTPVQVTLQGGPVLAGESA